MVYEDPSMGSLKRKRRRRDDKPPISARLFLDPNFRGEVGVVSEDLVDDLYPGQKNDGRFYVAVAPWTPHAAIGDSRWSILPFRAQTKDEKPLPPSTLRFSASALGTQSFINIVQDQNPNRTIRQNAAVEVLVTDVVPLALDTLYVSVDSEALQKVEEMQQRYGGGFVSANGYAAKRLAKRPASKAWEDPDVKREGNQRRLVIEALENVHIVHTGDILPLSLKNPVTHAPAPPIEVLACAPVSQGLLVSSTKIVITSAAARRQPGGHFGRPMPSPRLAEETAEDEDTSNEAFYSATEENSPAKPLKPIVTSKSATDLSNTDDLFGSSTEESNLSDDSDEMISLAKPGLPDQASGMSSVITSATPKPFESRTNGINTPGSVFSNVTASTIRGVNANRSKVLRTQGLIEPISDDLLHPKPSSEEDYEARIFVDATTLGRLGCFSGDWARIEPFEPHALPHLSAFGELSGLASHSWRPVKVYSIPETMSKRPPRYLINSKPGHGRRDSISSVATSSGPVATVYLSPILLANLDQAEQVTLSPLRTAKRPTIRRAATQRPPSAAMLVPPTASEVTLRKIVTPLSNERALNNVLFANLKDYFERKQRMVKAGDLIAVTIDQALGRSTYEGETEHDEEAESLLLSHLGNAIPNDRKSFPGGSSTNVAWFSVEAVNVPPPEDSDHTNELDYWGGVASIDPTRMTMRQAGDDRRKLPSASINAWRYYLGVRKAPTKASLPSPGIPEAPRAYVSSLQRRLRELISASISPRAVHLGLRPLAVLLVSTQRSIGKAYVTQRVCADLGIHYFPIDAFDIASEGGAGVDVQTQGLLQARCERALDCGPELTTICIKHIETLNSDRVATTLKSVLDSCRVLIATTTDLDKVPDSIRGLFTHELEMSAPDEGEREGILRDVVAESGVPLAPEVDLAAIAVKTAALVAGDLVDVVERALVARTRRLDSLARSLLVTAKDVHVSGGTAATSLTSADFDAAVDLARKNFADAIGAPKIPNVQWSDVGGLTHIKEAVVETIQLPLSRPDLFAKGLKKRSGILFYGPPGTGKTLLAKAIATEFSLNFFSVKGPELLNMYIGESEANVRRVFQRARDARPCVVFFDELDSVAPKRGNQGDSGGVMDRIVSQLLAELDGMSDGEETGPGVFVIGATNRPDLLDQALLRPGRFDKMLYLGISDTHEKQATILEALTRKFTLDSSLSLTRVAEALPFTFTGADLYALCSDAMLKAITRSARLVDDRLAAINAGRTSKGQPHASIAYYFDHFSSDDDTQVLVTEEDFTQARQELVPSVSLDELRHYERIRDTFEGATKNAGVSSQGVHPPASTNSVHNSHSALRAKLTNVTQKAPPSKHNPTPNGHGHTQPGATARQTGGETDDDYVVRTDRLSINGSSARSSPSKGKGKAKNRIPPTATVDAAGEDLYD